MVVHVGFDRADTDVRAAEHWFVELLGDQLDRVVACTHLLRVPSPHVAFSIALPSGVEVDLPPVPDGLAAAADLAREEHLSGQGGRAFAYPGRAALVGELTVAELLSRSAIERVTVMGGAPPKPDTLVHTRDHVRPMWMSGRLTLVTLPHTGGRIAPFEMPEEIPCCSLH
ncbi:hypothetical protein SAMN05421812_104410 [Asanoa hainanensis]|uniref:Uncharacterized protein n=1 Tax=Asanoa hainanensis TaxID=560556 RepID=A0A239LLC6_9ACTN|nr:hypothetical protein [Asanoa hainanensis]SNT31100.1 hypothetical protein SAMN05421812_104410 [Asanoa hainanensis]